MEREVPPSPERDAERAKPVFDFERLTAEQVAALLSSLLTTLRAESEKHQVRHPSAIADVELLVEVDLGNLPEHNYDKAKELFEGLITNPDPLARERACDCLAEPLMRQAGDNDVRRRLVDQLAMLSRDEDDCVRAAVFDAGGDIFYKGFLNTETAYLDTETADYLEDNVPHVR